VTDSFERFETLRVRTGNPHGDHSMKPFPISLLVLLVTLAPAVAEAQEIAPTTTPLPSQIILVLPAVTAPDSCGTDADADAEPEIAIEEHDETLAAPETFAPRPFSLGLSGLVGTRDDRGGIAPTWTAGLDVGLRVTPREDRWLFVDVGLRRITAGGADSLGGERWAVGASPAVSVGGRVQERIEVYLEVGAGLQTRFGSQGTTMGVAPFGGGGVRFFVADIFSIAIEGALHVPATRGFLLGSEVFPQAAAVFQGGLAFAFHMG
jgi:hypothetical protein